MLMVGMSRPLSYVKQTTYYFRPSEFGWSGNGREVGRTAVGYWSSSFVVRSVGYLLSGDVRDSDATLGRR
jgi:hypothetical protein